MIKKGKNKLKSETKSKILVLGLILIILTGLFSPMEKVSAVGICSDQELGTRELCEDAGFQWTDTTDYQLLAPLPCDSGPGCVDGKLTSFDPSQPNNMGAYLNLMIKIFIGLCAVLSVVMIVIGGIEYMTSELVHSKEAGKERITHAILGLLIALGAYALLFTINPDLLKSDINPPQTTPIQTTGTPSVTPVQTTIMPENMRIDIETGRSIYSIHTTRSNQGPVCSVSPDGYDSGKTIGGVGNFCGTGKIAPEKDGFYQFCCKYDRLTQ